MLKPLVHKFRPDASIPLGDIAERQVPAKLKLVKSFYGLFGIRKHVSLKKIAPSCYSSFYPALLSLLLYLSCSLIAPLLL